MHFLRLIRPINLVIIALTMYSVRFFYFVLGGMESNNYDGQERFDFALLVFSTVLIAAAGNIINDYFDVRTDRVNRPERLIITKHIKRRWAIIWHWLLNGVAFGIAIYLSVRYSTFWYVFIHLLSINSLWFYSMYFKRKPFIGNFIIAGLTALVPLLCGIHFYLNASFEETLISPELTALATVSDGISFWKIQLLQDGNFIYVLAFFAFVLNLSREIIKDMEDVKGDEYIAAKTLPIVLGNRKSARIAALVLSFVPLFVLIFFFKAVQTDFYIHGLALLPLFVAVVLSLIALLQLFFNSKVISALKRVDLLIKIAMLSGVLLPYYWWGMLGMN